MARNNLVYATGCTLMVGSFLDWKRNKPSAGKVAHGFEHPVKGLESSLLAQWIGIWILTIVLAFTIDQAPDFGTPLTILILVVALIKYEPAIAWGWNQIGKA